MIVAFRTSATENSKLPALCPSGRFEWRPEGTDSRLVPLLGRQYLICACYVNLDSISGQGWSLTPVWSRPRTTDLHPRGFGVLPFGQVHNTHRSTHVQGVLWYEVERVSIELGVPRSSSGR